MNYYGYECIRETDISHHGILGMKWGIRRYQNKDGSLTTAGKKHLKEKSDEAQLSPQTTYHEALRKAGYVKDPVYDTYVKSIMSPNSNLKNLTIEADIESGFGEAMSKDEYTKLLSTIEKNYNTIQNKIASGMADYAFNGNNEPWSVKGGSLEEKKRNFISKIGTQEIPGYDRYVKGYAHIRVMGDGYGTFGIDDGGAYGDHYLTTELDWKTDWKDPKVRYFSVEG